MEFLGEYLIFLAKTITIVLAIFAVMILAAALKKRQASQKGRIQLTNLSKGFTDLEEEILSETLSSDDYKKHKKEKKNKSKQEKQEKENKAKLFVVNFNGDIKASAVENLREEINAILPHINSGDKVLVKVESQGGMVHGYGLAASQLKRLTDKGVDLTISIDKVAASGGYMMACVGKKIIAAPFAIVGSIGVLAQAPNFNKLLNRFDIDYNEYTAGDYKRTISVLGKNTKEGEDKFKSQITDTHHLFKDFVKENRDIVDIDKVGTGEYWYGIRALELNLLDEIKTSDDFIMEHKNNYNIFKVEFKDKEKMAHKLINSFNMIRLSLTN